MDGNQKTGVWAAARTEGGAAGEKLDRALVAGLMLEVILETRGTPEDPQTRRRLVKAHLQDALVAHLAGRVTLKRFRHLLRQVDRWFPLYYPLINAGSTPGLTPAAPVAPTPPGRRALREDRLRAWFQAEGRGLLPRRPHRKLNQDGLWEFLVRTGGGWFKLGAFTRHFGVDRKTAWEYLRKLLAAGLLRHNQGRSAAVRYGLATRFLVVRAGLLESELQEAWSDLPPSLAGPVSGWLIATGGEAFLAAEWQGRLGSSRGEQIIARLQAAGILEEAGQVGTSRRLRLGRRWLRRE